MIRQSYSKYAIKFHIRRQLDDDYEMNYRSFPHTDFPVVILENGEPCYKIMNYSLIPSWSKDRRPKFATYNARIETICDKATWREPIKSKHCLVGFTSFFESCYKGTHAGNVVEFKSPESEILVAAGIWSEWTDRSTGEVLESFAMITTEPSQFIKTVGHDRSPLFVRDDFMDEWLSKSVSCNEAKVRLLESCHEPNFTVEIERPLKAGWEKRR